jgi:hypothetical protein
MKKLSPYAGVSFRSQNLSSKKRSKCRKYTQKLDLRFHQADFRTPIGFSPKILVQFDALNDHEIIIPLRRLQCKTQSRDLKTGKILIFDSPTLIRDGKINLTLIETESEIRHVGGAKLYIENGVYSDTVEFTSQSDPTLVLGYIDVIARITTKNSNQNSPNLSNETQSENLQSENRKEFLDSVGIHPCPPPMIYRFDSAVNQSLDTMQDTIKFNKKSEQNENQDKKKFQNFLIERLLKSASEELSLVHLTHHSSASSVSNPPQSLVSDDYYSNHSVQPMKTVRSSTRNLKSSEKVKKYVPSGTYDRHGRPTLKPVYSSLDSSLQKSNHDFRVLTRTYANKERREHTSKMVTTATQTVSDSATQTTRPQTARSKVSNVRFSPSEMSAKMSDKNVRRSKSVTSIGAQTETEFSLQQQTVLSCDISKRSKSKHLIGRNPLTDSQVSNHSHVTSLRISVPSVRTEIQTDTENKTESDYSSEFSQSDSPRSFSDVTETVSFSPIENIQNLDNLTSVLLPVRSKSPTFIH